MCVCETDRERERERDRKQKREGGGRNDQRFKCNVYKMFNLIASASSNII